MENHHISSHLGRLNFLEWLKGKGYVQLPEGHVNSFDDSQAMYELIKILRARLGREKFIALVMEFMLGVQEDD